MKRVHLYVNRNGELTRLCLWDDLRFKSIVTGLSSTKLCQAELDSQKEGEVILLAGDLMSGERIDFSNRRPFKMTGRTCNVCHGEGRKLIVGKPINCSQEKCDYCDGAGVLYFK